MNSHDAEQPPQRDLSPLPSPTEADLPLIHISHRTALEGYWWQLEQTPRRRISMSPLIAYCRAQNLRDAFRRTNGVLSEGSVVGMNWVELGVVPVNGQGLTQNERQFCAWAGQAMARIFAEEWAEGSEEGRK